MPIALGQQHMSDNAGDSKFSISPRNGSVVVAAWLSLLQVPLKNQISLYVCPFPNTNVPYSNQTLQVSHFWAEPVQHFTKCLNQHAKDRGLSKSGGW